MNIIKTEVEKINMGNDLAIDISQYLMGYLSQFNIQYYIETEKLNIYETFKLWGGLPLFLFDKQDFINDYINRLNKNNGTNFYVQLEMIQHEPDNYFGYIPNLKHNLIKEDYYKTNKQYYYDFIKALTYHILNKANFSIDKNSLDNKIYLDSLFNNFHIAINNLNNDKKKKRSQYKIKNFSIKK